MVLDLIFLIFLKKKSFVSTHTHTKYWKWIEGKCPKTHFRTHLSCGRAGCIYHLLHLGSLSFCFLEFIIFPMPSDLYLCYVDLKLFFFKVATLNFSTANIMTLLPPKQGHVPHCSIGGALVSWLFPGCGWCFIFSSFHGPCAPFVQMSVELSTWFLLCLQFLVFDDLPFW